MFGRSKLRHHNETKKRRTGSKDPVCNKQAATKEASFAAEDAGEFGGGEGEAGSTTRNQIDVARDIELANF